MIDLQRFCSTDPDRAEIGFPWTERGYTWATDGRVIVRVPACEGALVRKWRKDITEPFKWFPAAETEWITLPLVPPQLTKVCHHCNGSKKHEGALDCEWCDGTGKVPDLRPKRIGHRVFNDYYLWLLGDALQSPVEVAPDWCEQDEPMAFRFAEGCGMLMPMRNTAGEVLIV